MLGLQLLSCWEQLDFWPVGPEAGRVGVGEIGTFELNFQLIAECIFPLTY